MDERWLRPQARRMARLLMIFLACLWLFTAAFTGVAAVWWPTHGILENTPAEWFRGMTMMSLVIAPVLALPWLSDRRVSWRVGPGGLAMYSGESLRRSVAWPDVVSLEVRAFAVDARFRTRQFLERLCWLPPAEASWLREIARRQMDERSGTEPGLRRSMSRGVEEAERP